MTMEKICIIKEDIASKVISPAGISSFVKELSSEIPLISRFKNSSFRKRFRNGYRPNGIYVASSSCRYIEFHKEREVSLDEYLHQSRGDYFHEFPYIQIGSNAGPRAILFKVDVNRVASSQSPVTYRLAVYDIVNKILICDNLIGDREGKYYLKQILDRLNSEGLLPEATTKRNRIKKKEEKPTWDITFGADPEFEVLQRGKVINIREDNYTQIPSSQSTQIGVDGQGAQLELRPTAGKDENEITNNIEKLMREIKNIHTSSKGDTHAIGGHIHFGLKRSNGDVLQPGGISKLVKLLDYYIGEISLPASGEARGSYAHMGSHERKSYGFEYRTPPSAIFSSPIICKIAYKICRLIVVGAMVEGKTFELDSSIGYIKRLCLLGVPKDEAILFVRYLRKINNATTYDDNTTKIWLNKDIERGILELKKKISYFAIKIRFNGQWDSSIRKELETEISKIKTKERKISICLYENKREWRFSYTTGGHELSDNIKFSGISVKNPDTGKYYDREDTDPVLSYSNKEGQKTRTIKISLPGNFIKSPSIYKKHGLTKIITDKVISILSEIDAIR